MSTTMFMFDLLTGELTGSRPAQIVNYREITECANATPVPPPADVPAGHAARWTGAAWEIVEDHRQHMDERGTKQGGTAYWLPGEGDNHAAQPRYMEDLGPLPAGAVTERPDKALDVLKSEKEREINAACEAAIAASLTMPARTPSTAEVAVAAASLAVVDPDGPDTILAKHTARREELLSAVGAACSRAALDGVKVSFAV